MKNIAIYTSIFGADVKLYPQPSIKGVDYICFSDRMHKANGWKVIVSPKIYENDDVRNNRYYKILPHKVLKEYDYTIYIDGNFLILKSPLALIEQQMRDCNMLAFDHSQTENDRRDCIYKEYEAILELYEKKGILKDDLVLIKTQIDFYRSNNYPEKNGLIKGGVLIRKHNEPDVVTAMERWWYFIQNYSKRDQLSFNYVAWETGLKYKFLPGDIRRGNPWFYMVSKNDKNLKFSLFKYKLRRLIKSGLNT